MADAFLVPGLRTPFVKAGTFYAKQSALALMPAGAHAIVSICTDGGQGTAALLERA